MIRLQNPYGQTYRNVRSKVLTRHRKCRICGTFPASEAHHSWYHADESDTTEDDLVAVCSHCHMIITIMRKFFISGGDRAKFKKTLMEAIQDVIQGND